MAMTPWDTCSNGSGLSSTNYGATLVGWASRTEPASIRLSAVGIQYPASAAAAHAKLANTYHWSINDAGQG